MLNYLNHEVKERKKRKKRVLIFFPVLNNRQCQFLPCCTNFLSKIVLS
jgi:hypothetical protein